MRISRPLPPLFGKVTIPLPNTKRDTSKAEENSNLRRLQKSQKKELDRGIENGKKNKRKFNSNEYIDLTLEPQEKEKGLREHSSLLKTLKLPYFGKKSREKWKRTHILALKCKEPYPSRITNPRPSKALKKTVEKPENILSDYQRKQTSEPPKSSISKPPPVRRDSVWSFVERNSFRVTNTSLAKNSGKQGSIHGRYRGNP